jgi:arabinose-5-phosphate isomerase
MHKGQNIPYVPQDSPMIHVLREMSEKHLGVTCVTGKDGKLKGIITDGDLRRKMQQFGKDLFNKTAKDCMTAKPLAIDKDSLATEALNIMETNKVTSLIIKNKEGQIQGIIHLHDLWRTEMF